MGLYRIKTNKLVAKTKHNMNNLVNAAANLIGSQLNQGQEQQAQPSGANNAGSTNTNPQPSGIEAIGNIIGSLPHEQQKDMLFGYLGPIIKGLSPKWGDAIIAILKNVDIQKLLSLGKNQKELEETVKDEEKKLEEEEQKGKVAPPPVD